MSIRLACETFSISETCYRYQAKLSEENDLIADLLIRLTAQPEELGIRVVLSVPAQRQRLSMEPQARVYRIYRELELNLRIKPKKRIVREKPEPLAVPEVINDSWSMDFMHDGLS